MRDPRCRTSRMLFRSTSATVQGPWLGPATARRTGPPRSSACSRNQSCVSDSESRPETSSARPWVHDRGPHSCGGAAAPQSGSRSASKLSIVVPITAGVQGTRGSATAPCLSSAHLSSASSCAAKPAATKTCRTHNECVGQGSGDVPASRERGNRFWAPKLQCTQNQKGGHGTNIPATAVEITQPGRLRWPSSRFP